MSSRTEPAPSTEAAQVLVSAFDSLFLRALKVQSTPLADAFRQVGFDVNRLEPSYPQEVYNRCVAIAAEQLYPGCPVADVERSMGRRTVEYFKETFVGQVVMVAIPLLGPGRMLKRVPQYARMSHPGVEVQVNSEGERDFRLTYRNASGISPHLFVGMLEAGLGMTRCQPTFGVEGQQPDRFDIHVTW